MARDRLIARRRALGYTQQSLAYRLRCERSTVARWEAGRSEVSAHHRGPLAEALQWSLTELDAALNGSSDLPRADQGWWSNFVTLEQAATSVRLWEPILVPGLLQTKAYAAALIGNEDGVQRRLDRQRMVTRPGNPVDLEAIIDESVLHRPIGGPEVLAHQLRHLATMAERPNVTIQVMPFTAPAQPANWGAFLILGFDWPGGLVYLEHTGGSHSLDSRHDVEAHAGTFDQIRALALSPRESVGLILSRAMELEG
ncbi:MAG TPA: helix-turn-helix transcriptional regulator [Acidimicrobiales bacterium]